MTTHSYTGADATIDDPIELKLSGSDVVTRPLGDFTNSDLADWLPLTMSEVKGVWRLGPSNWASSTYQPLDGDGASDGSGFLRLTAIASLNSGWFSFSRNFCGDNPILMLGSTVENNNANGKYLVIGAKWSVDGGAWNSDVGFICPRHQDSGGDGLRFSLNSSQKFIDGSHDDGSSVSRATTGTAPLKDTIHWFRFTLGTDSVVATVHPTEADAVANTNADRTSTMSNIPIITLTSCGVFIRGTGASVDTLDIYKILGTVCDWYGNAKTATFDAVDFGASGAYLDFSTFTATDSGNVKYSIRVQTTDGVWDDYWGGMTAAQIASLIYHTKVYAVQVRAIFNECDGSAVASLTSLSFDSVASDPVDYPDRENVLTDDTVNGSAGLYAGAPVSKVEENYQYGANGTEYTGELVVNQLTYTGDLNVAIEIDGGEIDVAVEVE